MSTNPLSRFTVLVATARADRVMRMAQTKDQAGVVTTSPASIKTPDREEYLNARK